MKKLWNTLLDKSIMFSFDSIGYQRHSKEFAPLTGNLNQQTSLVSGGGSGIGKSVVEFLSKQGAQVHVLGRSKEKIEALGFKGLHSYSCDLSDWHRVFQLAEELPSLDSFVANAGGMPSECLRNEFGVEFQAASQLLGHYALFRRLHELGKLKKGAKIIWVSSGGMLLKKLSMRELTENKNYDKVSCYANVKRAQVIAVEELAKQERYRDYLLASMHPGWVDTQAVKEALPKFYKILGKRLRSLDEGSDTINWLLSTEKWQSGYFWFDRRVQNPYPLSSKKEDSLNRKRLMEYLDQQYQRAFSQFKPLSQTRQS